MIESFELINMFIAIIINMLEDCRCCSVLILAIVISVLEKDEYEKGKKSKSRKSD